MTPTLIELIVQAVMAEIIMNKKQWQIEPMSGNFYSQNDIVDAVRTALASIPEMPQVDLKQIEKYIQHTPDCAISVAHFDAIYYHITEIPDCTCGLSELLPAPPTTKGEQG